jgi:hypothetical protein
VLPATVGTATDLGDIIGLIGGGNGVDALLTPWNRDAPLYDPFGNKTGRSEDSRNGRGHRLKIVMVNPSAR